MGGLFVGHRARVCRLTPLTFGALNLYSIAAPGIVERDVDLVEQFAGHASALVANAISGDMLAFAERRARDAGLIHVGFVEADIEDHPLERRGYDVVVSRAALMYATDPSWTLRQLHSALRPGGRLAIAVWGSPDQVAFATPVAVMVEMGVLGTPPAGLGPFALGGDGVLEALVRDAGFADVRSGTAVATYETPSPEACTQWFRDVAPPITELIATQPAAVQADVWEHVTRAWTRFRHGDGAVRLPCTAVRVGPSHALITSRSAPCSGVRGYVGVNAAKKYLPRGCGGEHVFDSMEP